MTKQEAIDALAERYHIYQNEDGSWDMNDNAWDRGCYLNGRWFSLDMVISALAEKYLFD